MDTPKLAPVASDSAILSAIPWYRSPVIISQISASVSALVAIAPKNQVVTALGLSDPNTVVQLVTAVSGVIAVLSSLAGVVLRARSPVQPVTLTQVSADLHPNSLAVQQAQQKPERTPST